MRPQRIQRKRTKGWRMPEGVVYVGRPTRWGNPYKGEGGAATAARRMLVEQFTRWLTTATWTDPRNGIEKGPGGTVSYLGVSFTGRPGVEEIQRELRGKDLACWCPLDQPCHADVLLELANR